MFARFSVPYAILGFLLLALSMVVNWLMIHRVRILDVPNHRSSHDAPTPSSGGIGIVTSFLIGMMAMHLSGITTAIPGNYLLAFTISSLLVAGSSLYDDITHQPFHTKLVAQFIAVLMALAGGLVIKELPLPGVGELRLGWSAYLLTAAWLLGLTNAFNFMDGLDGLAGGTAAIAALFFAGITYAQGSVFVSVTCLTLAAGTLGFLWFNFPPARIFMGDVGSAFLGFAFAILAIIAASHEETPTPILVMPLLMFNFIYDTLFTFLRRWRGGENVAAAHKSHLYQFLNQVGYAHRPVALFHYAVTVVQGGGAVLLVQLAAPLQPLVFVPFLVFQLLYTRAVLRRARTAGIVD